MRIHRQTASGTAALCLLIALAFVAARPVGAQDLGAADALITDQLEPMEDADTSQLPALLEQISPSEQQPQFSLADPAEQRRSTTGPLDSATDTNRTPATPASSQESPFGDNFSFQPQLARANSMIGDLFGRAATHAKISQPHGDAVHHPVGFALGTDDLHFVTFTGVGTNTIFVGGPTHAQPDSFLSPSIPPPVPKIVDGLMVGGVVGHHFTAVAGGGLVDVFDDPSATSPTLVNAELFHVLKVVNLVIPGPNVSDVVGRVRLADNNSALPRDRFFFDFKHFHNVPLTADAISVNRLSVGAEKTFLEGMGSVELRVPMALTLSSNLVSDDALETSHYELGNAVIAPKILLTSNCETAVATGLGVSLPTADDFDVREGGGELLLTIENDAVHLIPYVALLHTPRASMFYFHGFLTVDVDTSGSSVFARLPGSSGQLDSIGNWRDQHLLSLSGSAGAYLYECRNPRSRVQGIALSTELHYTTTLNDADVVDNGFFALGDRDADLTLLNGTVGSHIRFQKATMTAAYTFPITSEDRVFDGEFRFFMNRFY